ncbi:unnamed protein product, partial [Ectocarpus fasciculatus]
MTPRAHKQKNTLKKQKQHRRLQRPPILSTRRDDNIPPCQRHPCDRTPPRVCRARWKIYEHTAPTLPCARIPQTMRITHEGGAQRARRAQQRGFCCFVSYRATRMIYAGQVAVMTLESLLLVASPPAPPHFFLAGSSNRRA